MSFTICLIRIDVSGYIKDSGLMIDADVEIVLETRVTVAPSELHCVSFLIVEVLWFTFQAENVVKIAGLHPCPAGNTRIQWFGKESSP